MIADFSPPGYVPPATGLTLKNFYDVRDAMAKTNAWIQYATTWLQNQLLPPLNNNVVGIAAPLTRTLDDHNADLDTAFKLIHELQREVAELRERLNV